jgi:hypothetical protein
MSTRGVCPTPTSSASRCDATKPLPPLKQVSPSPSPDGCRGGLRTTCAPPRSSLDLVPAPSPCFRRPLPARIAAQTRHRLRAGHRVESVILVGAAAVDVARALTFRCCLLFVTERT